MSKKSKEERDKLAQNKKFKRRWLTWLRMARYGANNFTRNAWLTTAATVVMTITLIIVLVTVVAQGVLRSTVDELRQKVDFSIYLKTDVSNSEVATLTKKLKSLPSVTSVSYTDITEAKDAYIKQNKPSVEQLQAISELPAELNPFFPSLRVAIQDPNDTAALANLVTKDAQFKESLNPDPRRKPSFAGDRKKVIETISQWATLAQNGGIIASLLFVGISMLIIFNTIRMAIFNRRDEIDMMKLIGADRNFIRGPFVVEAVMYGFFAAIAATALGYFILFSAKAPLSSYGIAISATEGLMVTFAPLVLFGMILLGGLIGSISARLAVRRYLKL